MQLALDPPHMMHTFEGVYINDWPQASHVDMENGFPLIAIGLLNTRFALDVGLMLALHNHPSSHF